MEKVKRIVIVGGSGRGKSTEADKLWRAGYAVFCGDPRSRVKEPLQHVRYLPEGLPYSGNGGGADFVACHWLSGVTDMHGEPMPDRWVLEGHVMARALKRWMEATGPADDAFPCDRIIVLAGENHRAGTEHYRAGQDAQAKGVMTTWQKIADYYAPITEWRVT